MPLERSEPNEDEERPAFSNRENHVNDPSNEQASIRKLMSSYFTVDDSINQPIKHNSSTERKEPDPELKDSKSSLGKLKGNPNRTKFELSQVFSTKSTMKGHFDEYVIDKLSMKQNKKLVNNKIKFYQAQNIKKTALNVSYKKRLINTSDIFSDFYYNPYYINKQISQNHSKNELCDMCS
jgi:hypothetical protein